METAQSVIIHKKADLRRLAAFVLRHRRRRAKLFDNYVGLFGEPVWDVLLDLYVNRHLHPVSVTSACLAAMVPTSTAMRVIKRMRHLGLITEARDLRDKRRIYVDLTEEAVGLIESWLKSVFHEGRAQWGREIVVPENPVNAPSSERGLFS